jgi:hypothetical protein
VQVMKKEPGRRPRHPAITLVHNFTRRPCTVRRYAPRVAVSALSRSLASALVTVGIGVAAVAAAPRPQGQGQEPSLEQVLSRATQYVLDYQQALSGVVSEERYSQVWRQRGRKPQLRALTSDVLLTRPAGAKRYVLFRDVFEVDGHPVRDRDDRLLQLFLSPSPLSTRQIVRILDEGTRYNIGDILRTVNTPTLALVFFDPQFKGRFRFDRSTDHTVETLRDAPAGDDTVPFTTRDDLWVIAYEETARETMLYTGPKANLPATGRFWIEPDSGRVVLTEIQLRNKTLEAVIDVRYDMAPAVGAFVPVAMRERYRNLERSSVIEGAAAYTRFRRFQVSESEIIKDPEADDTTSPTSTTP